MKSTPVLAFLASTLIVSGCGNTPYDPRGVDHDETLLSVSATGEADVRPDEAFFQVGVNNWSSSATTASAANSEDIEKVISALNAVGIEDKDIQTRAVGIQKIDYGERKGQFQASNIVSVTVREIDRASRAVTAATEAGANVLSGPDLRISDSERAANSAYGEAFKAARARAEAYADAAGMEIARVLTIRDGGGSQGDRYIPGAPPPPPVSPRPVVQTMAMPEMAEQSGRIMPGQTTSRVSVSVDFALREK